MQDLKVQCFVKRDYQPAFTSDSMPLLLYISRRLSSDQNHPRLLHAHPDFTEVLLMEEGSARFLIGETTYEVQAGGAAAGYALKIVSSGSQGNIEMMVGVDAEGVVTGVSIVKNSETAGIGSKVMANEPTAAGVGVLSQFVGKSAADGTLAVGTNVDAISGATVSSKGVTTGVNAALAVAAVMG